MQYNAAVAQSVVRRIGSAEVTGPIPVSSSIFINIRMSRGAWHPLFRKGCVFMAYDTLVKEAKDLPEEMIEQIIEFMRFLKYTSKKEQTKQSISNTIAFHRSVNPLSDEFIAIAEDFDETPECFKEYI